jgi:enoyl-CoA hydratase
MHYDVPAELLVEGDGPVRTLTLNRPDHLNAVNEALHAALATVWRQLAADRDARVVVITGAGRAFSAGGDLDWIRANLDDPVAQEDSLRQVAQIIDEMLRFPLPVIAAVNGPAVGLGCSIALLSDVVLLAESATLADPHVSVGLVAGDGGAAFWPLLSPIMRTREYLLTGDPIPARTAVELGLATRTVPDDQLRDEAARVAARVARQPAAAVQGTKRVLSMHLSRALAGAVQAGLAAEAQTMLTEEHRQRILGLRRTGRPE